MQIEFKEIPIFRFFDQEGRVQLGSIGRKIEVNKGDVILRSGGPVDGIYLVVDGTLNVSLPPDHRVVATVERGGTVGEMSLVEEISVASADIVVESPKAKIIMFGTHDILTLTKQHPSCAEALYRGAAVLISQRLRQTNKALQEHSGTGQKLIEQIMSQNKISNFLTITRSDVDDTSGAIVKKLASAIPMIEQILQAHPELKIELAELEQQIEDVFLLEAQKFDRISQQLFLIMQQFENIRRVAAGEAPTKLRGDTHLFDNEA